jgi:hypothetical protein
MTTLIAISIVLNACALWHIAAERRRGLRLDALVQRLMTDVYGKPKPLKPKLPPPPTRAFELVRRADWQDGTMVGTRVRGKRPTFPAIDFSHRKW